MEQGYWTGGVSSQGAKKGMRKLQLAVSVIVGVITMLAAHFIFDMQRNAVRLGGAAVLTMLVIFSRPWHKSVLTDDDEDEDLKES